MLGHYTSKASALGCSAIVLTMTLALGTARADDDDKDKDHDRDEPVFAMADIYRCGTKELDLLGRAVLVEKPSDQGVKTVVVRMKVRGLTPGAHGVHIHENAVCEPCGDAGGHFDPGPASKPSPDGNHPFHMGDLVNIHVGKNGKGKLQALTTRVTLSPGPLSVFDDDGSAFIIHDDEDTFCPEGDVTGCAGGSRAACGIIEPLW